MTNHTDNRPTPDQVHTLIELFDDEELTLWLYARSYLIDAGDPQDLDTVRSHNPMLLLPAIRLGDLIDGVTENREHHTTLLLDFTLCPLHHLDYAICFDDEDPECAAIRHIHPDHDT